MLSFDRIVEAAGITAAIAIALIAGLCIMANAAFKARGVPDDDGDVP